MIKLRDYQNQGVAGTRRFFAKGEKHAILQAPTGAGKTIIFSYITQNATAKGKKVLILTDRTELLMQTGGSLEKFGMKPSLIRAGSKWIKYESNVFVAMCNTLRNRLKNQIWINWILKDIDLIIIDECHKQDFNFIFESGLVAKKFVLGFTATPKRTGKMRQLALDYEEIIETASVDTLIKKGFLVADDYYGVDGVNLNDLKYDKMQGDYDEKQMFDRFNSPKLYAGVVENWLKIANNTITLVFCVNIEHIIHTCEEFNKAGIPAKFLASSMSQPKEPAKDAEHGVWVRYQERIRLFDLYKDRFGRWSGERGMIINEFKRGKFKVLVNAGILTTGFDYPEIETVVVNRATSSVTLWMQMLGRGSRIAPQKTHFNILDFGNNASRLGHYTAPRLWRLWHDDNNSGDGVAPMKDCGMSGAHKLPMDKNNIQGCGRMILSSMMLCPFCGYIYPKNKPEDVDLKGVLYDKENFKAIPTKKIADMDLDELFEYFTIKKHKMPWLWRMLYYRGGKELIETFGQSKQWNRGTIQTALNFTNGL
jgi:superfamily II DNA or RNA helicase